MLTWKDWLIHLPLAVFLFMGSAGYYALDLYLHPSWWNGVVFVLVGSFIVFVLWPRKKYRK